MAVLQHMICNLIHLNKVKSWSHHSKIFYIHSHLCIYQLWYYKAGLFDGNGRKVCQQSDLEKHTKEKKNTYKWEWEQTYFSLQHEKTQIIQVCRTLERFVWIGSATMPETRNYAGPVILGVIYCSRLQPFFQELLFLKSISDPSLGAGAVAVSIKIGIADNGASFSRWT